MLIKIIISIIIGYGFGMVVGTGISAFFSIIKIVPCMAKKTKTKKYVRTYENALMLGTLLGGTTILFNYYFPIGNIAKKAAKSGVPILTITDSDTSPAAAHSTLLLLCPTSTKLFYNSMTVPMAMLNILASCLVINSISPAERQIFIDTLPS